MSDADYVRKVRIRNLGILGRRIIASSFAFCDGTAKLLIEALSGRWSYDTERREKRTVWYHVANAFSLLVSTIAPMPNNEQIKVISNYDR